MFTLLEMFFASRRMARAEEAAKPRTCPECGTVTTAADARRHGRTHVARVMNENPLIIELQCQNGPHGLEPALVELKRRWPGRRFQLIGGSYAEDTRDGWKLRSVLAVEDDRAITPQSL